MPRSPERTSTLCSSCALPDGDCKDDRCLMLVLWLSVDVFGREQRMFDVCGGDVVVGELREHEGVKNTSEVASGKCTVDYTE